MNINSAFPSNYLKADQIDTDMTLTIKEVVVERIGQGADAKDLPVAYFNEADKGLILNKTNSATIAGLYGAETDHWSGKPVTLFSTEVDFQGKQTLAIRVRMRKPSNGNGNGNGKAAPKPAPAAKAETITEVERRQLFAVAKECGVDNEVLKALITTGFSFASSKDITRAVYPQVIEAVRGLKQDEAELAEVAPF